MAQFNSLIVTGGARFLNTIKGTIENSEKVGGHSTPASGNASSDQVVLGNDTRLTNSRTPTSHTHGNIQNGGTLQTNDITIASGDKIVVTDSSDSAKVARTSISFDGSTTTKALTQKGTWETFGTSNLTLGTTATTALKGDTKYAGSSSAGGSATSAVKLDTATAGSATQPCYFTGGKPSACTYSLNKTVPADAKFTDTTYSAGTGISLSGTTINAKIWEGTQAQYDAITQKDPNMTYFIIDSDTLNYGLNDLADVNITSLANGQLLTYDSANNVWKNVDNITTSGTITANSSGGWAANGWCKKYGNIVSFYIDGNKSSALASGWNTVATLPAGFRPTATFDFAMIDPGSDYASEGKVNTNGTVQVYKNSRSTTRIRCQTTFII